MKTLKIFLVAILFLTFVSVFAHGTGKALEINQGGYQIDIDLDTLEPKSGQTVRFDFVLLDIGGNELETNFDYIWIRIQKGQKVIFAGGIGKPDFGPTGFTTVLPESGTYIISARFQKDGEKLIEADTNFDVSRGEGTSNSEPFFNLKLLIGVIIGLIIGFFVRPFLNKN